MIKHNVILQSIDSNVEEEVTLIVNGIKIIAFKGSYFDEVHKGRNYSVEFELQIFDDYIVEELADESKGLERIDSGFSYWLKGKLHNGEIDCGVQFEPDEILLSDYGYLEGKFIRLKVDRIDVEFLDA